MKILYDVHKILYMSMKMEIKEQQNRNCKTGENRPFVGLFVLRGRLPSPSPAPSQNGLQGLLIALAKMYFARCSEKIFVNRLAKRSPLDLKLFVLLSLGVHTILPSSASSL